MNTRTDKSHVASLALAARAAGQSIHAPTAEQVCKVPPMGLQRTSLGWQVPAGSLIADEGAACPVAQAPS